MFKNRKVLIVVGVVVGLALIVGGYFLIFNRSKSQAPEDEFIEEQVAEEIPPEEIGLTMEANASKKAVRFMIEKAEGVKSIEYQVNYEADSSAAAKSEGAEDRIKLNITGEIILEGQNSYESKWLDLGSCSKNVCKYDTGVESVMLTLKIVKEDGKVYQVEKVLEL